MQISLSTECAIHSLVYLAMRPAGEICFVEEVAGAQHISASYLAKVFRILAKKGILHSYRGAKGGYRLAVDPAALTLRMVVETIEGSVPLFKCQEERLFCSLGIDCHIKNILKNVEDKAYEILEQSTIADIVSTFRRHVGELEWLNLANSGDHRNKTLGPDRLKSESFAAQ